MTGKSDIDIELRKKIIAKPDVILDDQDIMRALIKANENAMGANIIDIRGIAMERLETRLDRLENTNRSVIAAAYDNLAGTSQIQRAILRIMDAQDWPTFISDLEDDVREILRVDSISLVFESRKKDAASFKAKLGNNDIIKVVPAEFIDTYLTQGRSTPVRDVVLRKVIERPGEIYNPSMELIESEAALRLSFGAGRLPGMLLLGAEDSHQFSQQQGTDLLAFFAGFFERAMRRWLA
jgi:uncharacterized protein YigA (DUF484 family)